MFEPGHKITAADLNAIGRGSARRRRVTVAAPLQSFHTSNINAISTDATALASLNLAVIVGKIKNQSGQSFYLFLPVANGGEGFFVSTPYLMDTALAKITNIVTYDANGNLILPPFLQAPNPNAALANNIVAGKQASPYPFNQSYDAQRNPLYDYGQINQQTSSFPLAFEATSNNPNVPIGIIVPIESAGQSDIYGNPLSFFSYKAQEPEPIFSNNSFAPNVISLSLRNLSGFDIWDGLRLDLTSPFDNSKAAIPLSWFPAGKPIADNQPPLYPLQLHDELQPFYSAGAYFIDYANVLHYLQFIFLNSQYLYIINENGEICVCERHLYALHTPTANGEIVVPPNTRQPLLFGIFPYTTTEIVPYTGGNISVYVYVGGFQNGPLVTFANGKKIQYNGNFTVVIT